MYYFSFHLPIDVAKIGSIVKVFQMIFSYDPSQRKALSR